MSLKGSAEILRTTDTGINCQLRIQSTLLCSKRLALNIAGGSAHIERHSMDYPIKKCTRSQFS